MPRITRAEFRNAVEDILGVSRGSLRDADSRDSIENWSSVADVQLVALIASETGIEPDAELIEAETVGDMLRILELKGAFE